MQVKGLDIDVVDYRDNKDIYVSATYTGLHSYSVCVQRLDSLTTGWSENLYVFANFYDLNQTARIHIGPCESNKKSVDVVTEFEIQVSDKNIVNPTHYSIAQCPDLEKLSRSDFNERFQTDIVVLPNNLYAVGLYEGRAYIYNEVYQNYFHIDPTIKHILSVALTRGVSAPFYFIICGDDGYMECHYPALRHTPKQIGETECQGQPRICLSAPHEFAVLHKYKYVLGQNVQTGTAYTFSMPDRYYFCLNLYNQYRSYHLGIPFKAKKSQIVYASRPRGSHYNYTKRRDIFVGQREYFYSQMVPKHNIYAPNEIPCQDMVQYKYLLDIDGWGGTWEATAWKLNSGSVILKTESGWRQWFSDEYLPWIHYIPVDDDFSNLQERFAWCEAHQEECERMIRKAKDLFQKIYRLSAVMDHVEKVLRIISHP